MSLPLLPRIAFLACACLAWAAPIAAGPGAHGPGGEHLDAPSGAVTRGAPRLEAHSEAFELVARLAGGELTVLIDRYASNEPVLDAKLEVESGAHKATAVFHADLGDYAIDDKAFLEAISRPGSHALVFTVFAGKESDLLEGTLVVEAADVAAYGHDHEHGHLHEAVWAAIVALVLAAGVWLWRRVRKGRNARNAPTVPPAIRQGSDPLMGLLAALGVLCFLVSTSPMAAPGAHGPGGEHLDAPASPAGGRGLGRLPDGSVNLPKLAQRRMGVRTVVPVEGEHASTLELSGRVVQDPDAGGRVQSATGGRVEPGLGGLPLAGRNVKRGEVLAYVRHRPDPYALSAQQAQLAELRAARELAEQRVKRFEGLEGTVPRKDIEAARVELSSLNERERRVGAGLDAREALSAPVSGVIARAEVLAGQIVGPREVLFEITDPVRMLVEAYTADPALPARVDSAALAGIAGAELRYAGAARSLRDGLVPLSFRVRAVSGTLPLALGQPVTVIVALKERVRGIALPAQAVVRSAAGESVVWIKSGAERFIAQPVVARPLDAGTVVVTAGLAIDNRVVVQGAALIAQVR